MSPSLFDILAADAEKYLGRLRAGLDADGGPDVELIRRSARRLLHSAVLANHESLIHGVGALQKAAVQLVAGKRKWSDELSASLTATVVAVETVVAALPARDALAEALLRRAADDLASLPLEAPPAALAEPEGPEWESVPEGQRARAAVIPGDAGDLLTALITDLGDAVERLESDPRDREPLKLMLRKIRRLRELGRIEVLSPQDKALGAVEELILQIADLNATVGPGYLTVFAHAREVLEEMRGDGEAVPSITRVGGRAVEVDRLKDQVMEKVRRARQVVWVSDLFYSRGPHVLACPVAEPYGGIEKYFLAEAAKRLERCESLRRTMQEANTEQMRLAGESLSQTLRHLRERAAAFDHSDFGRVTRRAAAALRVQLVRPPKRLKELAAGLEGVFAALLAYIETDEDTARKKAVSNADAALHNAVLGDEAERRAEAAELDPDAILGQALSLRTRIDERLQELSGPEVRLLKQDLEELFDLISRFVSDSPERH
jgi:hypothetical protein